MGPVRVKRQEFCRSERTNRCFLPLRFQTADPFFLRGPGDNNKDNPKSSRYIAATVLLRFSICEILLFL